MCDTYNQLGEQSVQFGLFGHGQGGRHLLQSQSTRVDHDVRDLWRLVVLEKAHNIS